MKNIVKSVLLSAAIVGGGASGAMADLTLYDWGFNTDGGIDWQGDLGSGFDTTTGLGTITNTITGAGNHSILAFFDYELSEEVNTYFNEYGTATGTAAAGQSWEIDEPGYVFGNIYSNVLAGALDNTNSVPSGLEDDVSMAMGWDFSLLAGATATIEWHITSTISDLAGVDFYLTQSDPDSSESIYFFSTLDIDDGGTAAVPEPSTMLLVGTGLAGLVGMRRRSKK